MKGSQEVITSLNECFVELHTSMMKFIQFSTNCSLWGYDEIEKFFGHMCKEDKESMIKVIERISYLGGNSSFNINEIIIVETIEEMLLDSINNKNTLIASIIDLVEISVKSKDYGTRHLAEKMLVEEEKHLAVIEAKLIQFSERGKA